MTDVRDEYRHAGAEREVWGFSCCSAPGGPTGFGVVVWLSFLADQRVAWWWAGAVGLGPPLVALRATDIRLPPRGTTVRTDGLWAALECEEPLVHWSVGMECFGVAYDDPWEAARSERGDVVPFGLDLSFVASAAASPLDGGYEQWCDVTGEVLLGDDRVAVDCAGSRVHLWDGALPSPYVRARGGLGDAVGVCPFTVDGAGVWVETLHTGGWSGCLIRPDGRLEVSEPDFG